MGNKYTHITYYSDDYMVDVVLMYTMTKKQTTQYGYIAQNADKRLRYIYAYFASVYNGDEKLRLLH